MIFHITTQHRWKQLSVDTNFAPETYVDENFIHCCEEHQVEGVLARYFKDQVNLLKLTIDESKLKASLRYERGPNQELFPHLYGEINKDAIIRVDEL
jgi:uncharacterized protein (DUF952 family)